MAGVCLGRAMVSRLWLGNVFFADKVTIKGTELLLKQPARPEDSTTEHQCERSPVAKVLGI